MLVKKSAIREGIKFDRLYWNIEVHRDTVCDYCKFKEGTESFVNECDICSAIYDITGVDSDSINYAYIPNEDE